MKNCSDCRHMRVRIPVTDGERKRGMFDYRGALARCVKDHFGDQTFRMYNNRGFPKAWVEAVFCGDFVEANLVKELSDLIIQAHKVLNS